MQPTAHPRAAVTKATPSPPHRSSVSAPTPVARAAEQKASPAAAPPAVLQPPDAAPHIYSVLLQSQELHSGETVSGTVTTSSNVASVEARVAGYSAGAAHTGIGHFALSYRVPDLPFFLKGHTYTLQIIARNASGVATERDVPVSVR